MIEEKVCCQNVSLNPVTNPAIDRMVVWEFYDGPSTGLLTCSQCGAEFFFFMVDWSNNQRRRIFALQPTKPGAVKRLANLVKEDPVFPVWWPNEMMMPYEHNPDLLNQCNELVLLDLQEPSIALAWDLDTRRPLVMSGIDEAARESALPLLEEESDFVDHDWFKQLGMSR